MMLQLAYGQNNICDNHSVINLADRPTFAYGACVVPQGSSMFEFGAKHFKLLGQGESNLLPDSEYRLGLGWDTELDVNPPNYLSQSITPRAGFSYVSLGLKKLFYHDNQFVFTAEGFMIPPSGDAYFGSRGFQGGFNLITLYNWTPKLSMAIVIEFASYGARNEIQFEKYQTFSPDLALSYEITNDFVIYTEFYGQTHSSPSDGFGLIGNVGVIYQISKFATVDFEFGQRLIGQLNKAAHYIGVGSAIKFDG